MDFSYPSIKGKLLSFIEFIFYQQGRKYYFIFFLIGLSYLYVEKKAVLKKIIFDQRLGLFIIFVIFYFAFSAVNFYSARYLLSVFPIVAIVSVIIFYYVAENNKMFFVATLCVGVFFILNYYFIPFNDFGDTSKYYSKVVETQNNSFDKFIAQHPTETYNGDFLVNVNLQNIEMGYLKKIKPIQVLPIDQSEYVIATCIDQIEEQIKPAITNSEFVLVYESRNEPAWCRIYKRN